MLLPPGYPRGMTCLLLLCFCFWKTFTVDRAESARHLLDEGPSKEPLAASKSPPESLSLADAEIATSFAALSTKFDALTRNVTSVPTPGTKYYDDAHDPRTLAAIPAVPAAALRPWLSLTPPQ